MAVDLHRNATSIHKGRYIQATDPALDGPVADGVEWLDISGTLPVAKRRASGAWVTLGILVPPGGTTGQALVKASDTNFDVEWGAGSGGVGGGSGDYNFAATMPISLSDVTVWYKADAGVYSDAGSTPATDGGTVQQWNDQSGNGNHATQATSGNRPLYQATVHMGRQSLYFDGTNDTLVGPTLSTMPFTIVLIYTPRSSGQRRVITGSGNWLMGPYATYHTAFSGGQFLGQISTVRALEPACLIHTASSAVTNGGKISVNGLDVTTFTHAPSAPGVLYVGGNGGTNPEPFEGWLHEVLVLNKVASAAEIVALSQYANSRWIARPAAT